MLEPLLEQLDDVLIVEGVVDVLAVAPRSHQSHDAQQPELVRNRGLRQSENVGEVAYRHFGLCERVQDAYPRRVAQHLEGLGQRGGRSLVEKATLQPNI